MFGRAFLFAIPQPVSKGANITAASYDPWIVSAMTFCYADAEVSNDIGEL
jgi:hypothetical protein